MPSDETIRRILAGEPVGSGAGQSPERTRAVAPLLAGFPRAASATANALVGLASLGTEASRKRTRCRSASIIASAIASPSTCVTCSARATSTRRTAPSRRGGSARSSSRRTWSSTISRWPAPTWSTSSRSATTARRPAPTAFSNQANYDPVGVSLSGTFTSSSIDARGNTGIARSGLLIRATSASTTTGSVFDPRSISINNATTWTRGSAHLQGRLRVPEHPVGFPVPRQHRDHLQQHQ